MEIAQRQQTPIARLKTALSAESVKEQFRNAMGENSDLFVASLIDVYGSDKNIQACDPGKVIMEALKAATLRLPINKSLGFAYIVAYGGSPAFQIGYKGYIQLAMRTGQYKYINADVVYEGEFRKFDKLTGALDISGTATSDVVVGYFAHYETVNGFRKTLYWSKEQMEAHGKKYSKSYSQGFSPWKTEFDKMGLKTMLRALLGKYGVMSVDIEMAFKTDSADTKMVDEAEDNEIVLGGEDLTEKVIGDSDVPAWEEGSWNMLKEPGMIKYAKDNADTWKDQPVWLKNQFREKWERVCGDKPFPFNERPTEII